MTKKDSESIGFLIFYIGLTCLAAGLFGWVGFGIAVAVFGALVIAGSQKKDKAANDSKLH